VIIFYDPKYKHYVVFCFGTPLHFVHSDSTKELGIEEPTQSKPWILAEILEKEYCLARKVIAI